MNDVAFHLVRLQEENMVLKPWALISTLLLQNPDGMELSALTQQTDWLRRLALGFGAFLDWPGTDRADYLYTHTQAVGGVVVCRLELRRNPCFILILMSLRWRAVQ